MYKCHGCRHEDLDLTKERAKLAQQQTLRHEIDNKEKQGQLVPLEAVSYSWRQRAMYTRNHFLSLPSKLAPLVMHLATPAEAFTVIQDLVYECLTELSQTQSYQFNSAAKKRLKVIEQAIEQAIETLDAEKGE